jgi:hypothetical protein
MDRSAKATPEIKQALTELTPQHPNVSDFQTAQMISERVAIPVACPTINQLGYLPHFKFISPKRCQKLTEVQRRQCYQFASDFSNGKLPTYNLTFSDRSRFSMDLGNR